MKTTKKIIFENPNSGIKVYRNKHNLVEITRFGKNITTPDSHSEFHSASVFINGLRVKRLDGREMCLLLNPICWFRLPCGTSTFTRIFPFGEIAASVNGEQIQNYKSNHFFMNLLN